MLIEEMQAAETQVTRADAETGADAVAAAHHEFRERLLTDRRDEVAGLDDERPGLAASAHVPLGHGTRSSCEPLPLEVRWDA